jgi:hypothetical protein
VGAARIAPGSNPKPQNPREEKRLSMATRFLKWLSIVALLLGLLMRSSASYRIVLELVVCVAALAVIAQAFRTGKYLWGAGFVSIAVLFNPVAPFTLPGSMFLWLDLACVSTFALSLALLKTKPPLSIQGIIHPNRQSESL